jgi:hypothetical protein
MSLGRVLLLAGVVKGIGEAAILAALTPLRVGEG